MKRIYRPELNRLMDDWRSGDFTRRGPLAPPCPSLLVYGVSETNVSLGVPLRVTGTIYSGYNAFLADYLNHRLTLTVAGYNVASGIPTVGSNMFASYPDCVAMEPLSSNIPGRILIDLLPIHLGLSTGTGDYVCFNGNNFCRTSDARSPWKILSTFAVNTDGDLIAFVTPRYNQYRETFRVLNLPSTLSADSTIQASDCLIYCPLLTGSQTIARGARVILGLTDYQNGVPRYAVISAPCPDD